MNSHGKTLKKSKVVMHIVSDVHFLFCHAVIKRSIPPCPQYLPFICRNCVLVEWEFVCSQSGKQRFLQYWQFLWNDTMNCTFHLYVPANQTHLFYKAESLTLGVSTANWMCSSENEVLLSLTPPVPPEIKSNSSFADRSIRAEEGSPHSWLVAQVGIVAFSSYTVFF